MPKVITITNEKGGVAKTTTTINLGVGLARHRKKVLLVDCNMQADLTSCFLREDEIQSTLADAMIQTMDGSPIEKLDFIHPTKEGVDVIPAEKALIGVESQLVTALSRENILRRFLEQVQEGYDYVLLDCPAGLSQIVINAMVASDGVIIPTEPGADSFSGVYGAVENVRKIKNLLNPSLDVTGILITKADLRTNLHRRFALQIKETLCLARNRRTPGGIPAGTDGGGHHHPAKLPGLCADRPHRIEQRTSHGGYDARMV